MTPSFELDEAYVFRIAPDGKSTKAALDLLRRGAFRRARMTRHGTRLEADCHGSDPTPYAVLVDLEDPASPRLGCSCPSPKHPCKHALGLLFLAVHSPDSLEKDESSRRRQRSPAFVAPAKARKDGSADADAPPPRTTEEAFLRDILDHPEDEAPRLIFADWLEETGGPAEQARATFIRVQMELARLSPQETPPRALTTQEKKLWSAHREAWLASFPAKMQTRRDLRFRRGFFEELALPPTLWARNADRLFATNPLFRLAHPGKLDRNAASAMVVLPQMARIRVLVLARCVLDEPLKTLEILFSTPFFSGVTTLLWSDATMGSRELAVLLASPLLPRLHELDLSRTEVGTRGIEALAASEQAGQLRILRLAGASLADADVRRLIESASLAGLEQLDLRGVALSAATQASLRARFDGRVLLDACEASPG
ncbi:MAG: TIGR02996 domain-containing protein [Gemmataceae bacterium]